jgi:exo-beta-1,3-glucanase (GH17 family)
MKKLLLLAAALLFISCSKEEDVEEDQLDCNCDRVVEVNTFNVVGTPQNPALNYHSVFITINDCSGIQRQKTHNTTNINLVPKIGECR